MIKCVQEIFFSRFQLYARPYVRIWTLRSCLSVHVVVKFYHWFNFYLPFSPIVQFRIKNYR